MREELSLAASVGVAAVKFVAKIASDVAKPDGLKVVEAGETRAFLEPLPIERLFGVGPKTAKLLRSLGIETLGQIARHPAAALAARVGAAHAAELQALARGEDTRHVIADRAAVSIGAEETFEHDLVDGAPLRRHVTAQAERVAERLRRTHQLAGCVVLEAQGHRVPHHDAAAHAAGGDERRARDRQSGARAPRRGPGARAGRAPVGRGGDVDRRRRGAAPAVARRARRARAASGSARRSTRSAIDSDAMPSRVPSYCPTTTEARMADDKKTEAEEATQERSDKPAEGEEAKPDENTSKLGRFIMKYHTFLSSFVIGAAGLIATSIWQYRQSVIAAHSAESQQKVAETQADNQWRIERAEILAKNLPVLAAQGPGSVEQRYGVLLSLARGNILDPELAVSYALELGKDNPDYMESVLANTAGKDYHRLSRSYILPCEEKYGLARPVPICATDKLASRSAAIAQLISDETQAAQAQGQPGPLVMLKDEREVQQNVSRFAGLFEDTLNDYYERRLWNEIAKFEAYSTGRARRRRAGAGGGAHRRVRHRRRGQEARRVPRRAGAVDVEVPHGLDVRRRVQGQDPRGHGLALLRVAGRLRRGGAAAAREPALAVGQRHLAAARAPLVVPGRRRRLRAAARPRARAGGRSRCSASPSRIRRSSTTWSA